MLVKDIEHFAPLDTPYWETHVWQILRALEKEGRIGVARPGRTGFPSDKTRITLA